MKSYYICDKLVEVDVSLRAIIRSQATHISSVVGNWLCFTYCRSRADVNKINSIISIYHETKYGKHQNKREHETMKAAVIIIKK